LQLAEARAQDLALVDIELRRGESGLPLAQELRQRGIPSIFVTGQPRLARAHRALALGLIGKPYLPSQVVSALSWIAAARSGQPPSGFELFDDLRAEPTGIVAV